MIGVDASLALKWLIPEPRTDKAEALLVAARTAGESIVASPLLPFEITNILRQRVRRGSLDSDDATRLLAQFEGLPIELVSRPLHQEALQLPNRFNLSAAYDAHYVAIARILACDFWTDDLRLVHSVSEALPFVRWIGDFIGTL